jgi:hypothetical protein
MKTLTIWSLSICLTLKISNFSFSQPQTVGIFLNTPEAQPGYTLLCPMGDTTTYLLDNCGQVVHRWTSSYQPGLMGYLLPDGRLLRAAYIPHERFGTGLRGGRVELMDWDGNLLWSLNYFSPEYSQHHDIEYLPNGNILLLSVEHKSQFEAIDNGRNPLTAANGVWAESVIEIKPVGIDSAVVVWEWHAWDHVIQDFDPAKLNYGVIAENPGKLNLNYPLAGGEVMMPADWLHGNSVAYNEELDQIVISSRTFSEFFVIDHTTTSLEAATSSGGAHGKGGDIIYRWGNPLAYNRGQASDQRLFNQHNVHWIPKNHPGAGNILVFNNGSGRADGTYSSADEIIPELAPNGSYVFAPTDIYGPENHFWRYVSDPPEECFSAVISGAQRLSNGNTLVCEGVEGRIFEVTPGGTIVWEYINPSRHAPRK